MQHILIHLLKIPLIASEYKWWKILPIRILIAIHDSKRLDIHATSLLKNVLCIDGAKLFQLTPDPHYTQKVAEQTNQFVVLKRKNEEPIYKHLAL